MNNKYSHTFVKPVGATSPANGFYVHPKLEDVKDKWGVTTTNAKWVDPSNGQIFKQGIVSIKERDGTTYNIETPEGKK